MKKSLLLNLALLLSVAFLFNSCELEEEQPTPTNELMEGVWEVTEIYNANGVEKRDELFTTVFPSYIQLTDQESVNSTLGPLFMYLVYGESGFINVTGKLTEVFNYADLQLTEGDWFIDKNKVVDKFTIKVKLRIPTGEVINEVFELLNAGLPEILEDAVDVIVHHKFRDVTVTVSDDNPDRMVWEFTDETVGSYNTMDKYGDPVLYIGIDSKSFQRSRIVLERKAKGLIDLVEEAVSL